MKQKLLVVLMSICLLISSYSFIYAEPSSTKMPDTIIKEYLIDRMQSLVSKDVDVIDQYFSSNSEEAKKYALFIKRYILEDYLISFASSNYNIEKVSSNIDLYNMSINGDTANVDVTIQTDVYWNVANSIGEPIIGKTSEKHTFALQKEENDWKIVSDKFLTKRCHSSESQIENLSKMKSEVEKLKRDAKDKIEKAKRSKPAKLTIVSSDSDINNKPYTASVYTNSRGLFRLLKSLPALPATSFSHQQPPQEHPHLIAINMDYQI